MDHARVVLVVQHNEVWDDAWTVTTLDKSRCAQLEHSLAVTPTGADILTLP